MPAQRARALPMASSASAASSAPRPRFPAARIKKLMQADEDVGRVAAGVLPLVSTCLEQFGSELVARAAEAAVARSSKALQVEDLKACVDAEPLYDFLKVTVKEAAAAAVASGAAGSSSAAAAPKRQRRKPAVPAPSSAVDATDGGRVLEGLSHQPLNDALDHDYDEEDEEDEEEDLAEDEEEDELADDVDDDEK